MVEVNKVIFTNRCKSLGGLLDGGGGGGGGGAGQILEILDYPRQTQFPLLLINV